MFLCRRSIGVLLVLLCVPICSANAVIQTDILDAPTPPLSAGWHFWTEAQVAAFCQHVAQQSSNQDSITEPRTFRQAWKNIREEFSKPWWPQWTNPLSFFRKQEPNFSSDLGDLGAENWLNERIEKQCAQQGIPFSDHLRDDLFQRFQIKVADLIQSQSRKKDQSISLFFFESLIIQTILEYLDPELVEAPVSFNRRKKIKHIVSLMEEAQEKISAFEEYPLINCAETDEFVFKEQVRGGLLLILQTMSKAIPLADAAISDEDRALRRRLIRLSRSFKDLPLLTETLTHKIKQAHSKIKKESLSQEQPAWNWKQMGVPLCELFLGGIPLLMRFNQSTLCHSCQCPPRIHPFQPFLLREDIPRVRFDVLWNELFLPYSNPNLYRNSLEWGTELVVTSLSSVATAIAEGDVVQMMGCALPGAFSFLMAGVTPYQKSSGFLSVLTAFLSLSGGNGLTSLDNTLRSLNTSLKWDAQNPFRLRRSPEQEVAWRQTLQSVGASEEVIAQFILKARGSVDSAYVPYHGNFYTQLSFGSQKMRDMYASSCVNGELGISFGTQALDQNLDMLKIQAIRRIAEVSEPTKNDLLVTDTPGSFRPPILPKELDHARALGEQDPQAYAFKVDGLDHSQAMTAGTLVLEEGPRLVKAELLESEVQTQAIKNLLQETVVHPEDVVSFSPFISDIHIDRQIQMYTGQVVYERTPRETRTDLAIILSPEFKGDSVMPHESPYAEVYVPASLAHRYQKKVLPIEFNPNEPNFLFRLGEETIDARYQFHRKEYNFYCLVKSVFGVFKYKLSNAEVTQKMRAFLSPQLRGKDYFEKVRVIAVTHGLRNPSANEPLESTPQTANARSQHDYVTTDGYGGHWGERVHKLMTTLLPQITQQDGRSFFHPESSQTTVQFLSCRLGRSIVGGWPGVPVGDPPSEALLLQGFFKDFCQASPGSGVQRVLSYPGRVGINALGQVVALELDSKDQLILRNKPCKVYLSEASGGKWTTTARYEYMGPPEKVLYDFKQHDFAHTGLQEGLFLSKTLDQWRQHGKISHQDIVQFSKIQLNEETAHYEIPFIDHEGQTKVVQTRSPRIWKAKTFLESVHAEFQKHYQPTGEAYIPQGARGEITGAEENTRIPGLNTVLAIYGFYHAFKNGTHHLGVTEGMNLAAGGTAAVDELIHGTATVSRWVGKNLPLLNQVSSVIGRGASTMGIAATGMNLVHDIDILTHEKEPLNKLTASVDVGFDISNLATMGIEILAEEATGIGLFLIPLQIFADIFLGTMVEDIHRSQNQAHNWEMMHHTLLNLKDQYKTPFIVDPMNGGTLYIQPDLSILKANLQTKNMTIGASGVRGVTFSEQTKAKVFMSLLSPESLIPRVLSSPDFFNFSHLFNISSSVALPKDGFRRLIPSVTPNYVFHFEKGSTYRICDTSCELVTQLLKASEGKIQLCNEQGYAVQAVHKHEVPTISQYILDESIDFIVPPMRSHLQLHLQGSGKLNQVILLGQAKLHLEGSRPTQQFLIIPNFPVRDAPQIQEGRLILSSQKTRQQYLRDKGSLMTQLPSDHAHPNAYITLSQSVPPAQVYVLTKHNQGRCLFQKSAETMALNYCLIDVPYNLSVEIFERKILSPLLHEQRNARHPYCDEFKDDAEDRPQQWPAFCHHPHVNYSWIGSFVNQPHNASEFLHFLRYVYGIDQPSPQQDLHLTPHYPLWGCFDGQPSTFPIHFRDTQQASRLYAWNCKKRLLFQAVAPAFAHRIAASYAGFWGEKAYFYTPKYGLLWGVDAHQRKQVFNFMTSFYLPGSSVEISNIEGNHNPLAILTIPHASGPIYGCATLDEAQEALLLRELNVPLPLFQKIVNDTNLQFDLGTLMRRELNASSPQYRLHFQKVPIHPLTMDQVIEMNSYEAAHHRTSIAWYDTYYHQLVIGSAGLPADARMICVLKARFNEAHGKGLFYSPAQKALYEKNLLTSQVELLLENVASVKLDASLRPHEHAFAKLLNNRVYYIDGFMPPHTVSIPRRLFSDFVSLESELLRENMTQGRVEIINSEKYNNRMWYIRESQNFCDASRQSVYLGSARPQEDPYVYLPNRGKVLRARCLKGAARDSWEAKLRDEEFTNLFPRERVTQASLLPYQGVVGKTKFYLLLYDGEKVFFLGLTQQGIEQHHHLHSYLCRLFKRYPPHLSYPYSCWDQRRLMVYEPDGVVTHLSHVSQTNQFVGRYFDRQHKGYLVYDRKHRLLQQNPTSQHHLRGTRYAGILKDEPKFIGKRGEESLLLSYTSGSIVSPPPCIFEAPGGLVIRAHASKYHFMKSHGTDCARIDIVHQNNRPYTIELPLHEASQRSLMVYVANTTMLISWKTFDVVTDEPRVHWLVINPSADGMLRLKTRSSSQQIPLRDLPSFLRRSLH